MARLKLVRHPARRVRWMECFEERYGGKYPMVRGVSWAKANYFMSFCPSMDYFMSLPYIQ